MSEFLVVASNYFNPIRDKKPIQINEQDINGNVDGVRAAFAVIIAPLAAAPVIAPLHTQLPPYY
jgi:hypothetical protein